MPYPFGTGLRLGARHGTLKGIPDHRWRSVEIAEFVSWTAAYFQSEEARDRFLSVVVTQQMSEIEAKPMPGNSRGARVRWRPGHFLDLNDVAYTCGGRIVVPATRRSRSGFRT